MADEERQDDAQQPEDEQQQPEGAADDAPEAAADDAPEAAAEETPEAGDDAPAADETPEAAGDDAPAAGDDAPAADETPAAADDAPAADGPSAEAEEGAPAAEPESAPDSDSVEEAPEPDATPEETEPESAEAAAEEAPAADGDAEPARERPRRRDRRQQQQTEDEVIPGAHLEPDLVLEEEQRPEDEYAAYAEDEAPPEEGEGDAEATEEDAPVAHTPLDLAADARYQATGKRKSAVARVILKPGEGTYSINGRHLDEYFPRVRLQRMARQPLEAAGYHTRMDVVARIHGGGVSSQAGALRHGIARALVDADPNLRTELKRRGYLTRDPRVKERKKAGLKKARKRPQFSKR
jgi:small subunit ribosomal protein S9